MDYVQLIGLTASFFTTVSFVPQAVKVYKTKETKSISLGMFVLFTLGITAWLAYGLLISDLPIISCNSVSLVLAIYILIMKIRLG
jgi:MtN3 and saliva related transmembrane protein